MRNVTRLMQTLFATMLMVFVFAFSGNAQVTLLTESFDAGTGQTPPAGWVTELVSGSNWTYFNTSGTFPTVTPYNGTRLVEFQSWNASSGTTNRLKRTTALSTVGYTNVAIDFAWYEDPGSSGNTDRVEVQWSTNGTVWTTAATFNRYNAVAGWKIKNVTLPAGAQGQATLYIAFNFISQYGYNCHLDFAHVTAIGPPPPATVTVGTGTSTTSYPYYTFYMDARTQMLYTAAEIIAGGGGPGEISSVGFNVASRNAYLMNGFNIRLQNTTLTTLPGYVTSGWTTVYTGTYTVPATGWQMITLQTPFVWDGSNLLMEVCFDNTGYSGSSTVYATSVAANMVKYYYTDNSTGCSMTSILSPTLRPNLRFVVQPWVGTISGTVTNSYNGLPLNGATVAVPGMPNATTNASGIYTMYNVPVGNKNVTASMTNFLPQTKPALVTNNMTTTVDFALDPIPGVLSGIVYNAANGNPLVGAEITVNGKTFYSVAGGAYTANVYPVGTFNTTCGKPGFNTANQTFTYVQGTTLNYNWGIWPTEYPPVNVTATLNTAETQVDINWLLPYGWYEQIYDDGIAENWTVWAQGGNRNAVKFTPLGYPAWIGGGFVNIGTINNYPSGSTPLVPFQIAVYDASGPGGTPGVALDTFDVTPTDYGWVPFTFPTQVMISSGSFYLVMIQGGNAPNAAGIAIDETTPQLRSYSSFNNGVWVPAGGNFLLRAVINGSGGPLLLDGQAPTATLIEGQPNDNAIYQNTPTTASGYEGKGTVKAFDWSTFADGTVPDASIKVPTGLLPAAAENAQGAAFFNGHAKELTNRAVLWNNGPLVNSAGTGAGGADESVVIAPMTTLGANFNQVIPYTLCDDFTVSGGTWTVSSIEAFGYQTGSTTTSTFTGIYLRIWNGKPGTAGATVIWGDLTTNRMASTTFSNIYRVSTPGAGTVNRPIMKIIGNTPGLSLTPGIYWIEIATTGSLASGPWGPPITITGQQTTGNGLQYVSPNYNDWMDTGSGTQQGLPFIVNGTVTVPGGLNYEVWRLKQGEEGTPGVWTSLGQTTALSAVDASWPTLPCGPYRWAVEAIYPVGRYSAPAFSNVLGKCWEAGVTVNVTPSCTATTLDGSLVKLQNNAYPDTMYMAVTGTTGQVVFPNVWKGNYTLTVTRFNYTTYTQVLDIMGDMTIDVMLLQVKTPPTDLFVDDRSLEAIWYQPRVTQQFWLENWSSGSFTTNGWVEDPTSSNWAITTSFGNPSPSAVFNYSPEVYNYDHYLTSKELTNTLGAPVVYVKYDIYLSNFGTTYENTMAVEVWDGLSWHVIAEHTNFDGSMPWTTEYAEMSPYADGPFKIRFHAAGEDSWDINNWNIDNIALVGSDGASGYNPCVLGYNFYLNTVLSAFVTDTVYTIPGNHVQYGQTYNACVLAVYGSGYSTEDCYTFTSHFLYPPRNLQVEAIECNAYLTWEKPVTAGDGDGLSLRAFDGEVEHTPAVLGLAPKNMSNQSPVSTQDNGPKGSIVFGVDASATSFVDFDVDNLGGMTVVGPAPTANFWHGAAFPVNDPDICYMTDGTANLFEITRATGAIVNLGSMGSVSGTILDMTVDPTTGTFYLVETNSALSADDLYTVDPSVPSRTLIGPCVNSAGMIGLAADDNGDLWGYDLVNDRFYSVDKATGTASIVGSIGFSCNYGQNMFYDQPATTITMASFNAGSFMAEIRAVDVTTGTSVILSSDADQMTACAHPIVGSGGGGQTPPGLIGYNVYRDGDFIAYVSGMDTTWYYDLNLDPDTYEYAVTAKYDLTVYGFPGMFDESLIEGPVSIQVSCGRPLPFYEPWDAGTFSFNDWTFGPTQGNWVMNTGLGNPAPSADFQWLPMITDYEFALESPVLNAGPWTCAALWFDFDYKLADRNATGDEYLSVEVFYNGSWHQKAEYANNGSVDWTSEHFDISTCQGKALKVRFVAYGANSEDILHWYVDNIHVYGICNPPVDVAADVQDKDVILTWTAPTCEGGGGGGTLMQFIFDDGTAENGWAINPGYLAWMGNEFPIAATYEGVIQSFDVWFGFTAPSGELLTIEVFDGTQTLVGASDPFTSPNEDWLTVLCNDIPFQGMFYGMTKWDNFGGSTNYMGFDEDGPYAADDLEWYYDGSTWDKLTNVAGSAPGVFLLRATALVNGDLKTVQLVPGQQPTGRITDAGALVQFDGYFDTKNYGTTGVVDNETDSSQILGYNVYRQDPGSTVFEKRNAALITATTYTETVPDYGMYYYYVTSYFNDSEANTFLCESPSDTIEANVLVGVPQLSKDQISIYPNPATEVVYVKSSSTITTIEVMNFVGQSVATMSSVDSQTAKVNVTTLRPGVYFVKVTTSEGIRTAKITVTR